MKLVKAALGLVSALPTFVAGDGALAQAIGVGIYACTVEQRASISSTHLEGARPPEASASGERYRFRIRVSGTPESLRIAEAPYDGPDSSRFQWEDENSTLHSEYVGDGRSFTAVDGPGFMKFGRDRSGDGLQFFHSGFEYAGGEDEHLSVRWGRCAVER